MDQQECSVGRGPAGSPLVWGRPRLANHRAMARASKLEGSPLMWHLDVRKLWVPACRAHHWQLGRHYRALLSHRDVHSFTGRHRRSTSRPPHGSGQCTPPRDATGKRPPASPSRGCYGVVLYNETRTHLGLRKDAPLGRAVQRSGTIVPKPILSGLHHRYARI